jgi:large subunit ribosomal protein L1
MRRAVIAALARASGQRAALLAPASGLQQQRGGAAAAAAVVARRGFATEGGGSSGSSPASEQPSWLYDASLLPSSSTASDAAAPSTPLAPLRPPRLVAAAQAGNSNNGPSAALAAPGRRRSGPSSSSQQPKKLPLLEALRALTEARAAAAAAAKKAAATDETVEMHVRLRGVDPRRGDHAVRGAAALPHAVGRPPRVAVFAEPGTPAAEAAKAAGADVVGGAALVDEIVETKGRSIAFDRAVAHPDLAAAVARAGRVLGPRGLMPNPKLGTLTADVARAVRELRRGRVEFRADRAAALHLPLGKLSSGAAALAANAGALAAAVLAAKPEAVKAGLTRLLAKVDLATTFGRGSVGVDVASLLRAADEAAAALRRQQRQEEEGREGADEAAAAKV